MPSNLSNKILLIQKYTDPFKVRKSTSRKERQKVSKKRAISKYYDIHQVFREHSYVLQPTQFKTHCACLLTDHYFIANCYMKLSR